jgi:hypothetical protein
VPRIDVPGGRDPLLHLWGGTGNELTGPAAAFSDAVYRRSTRLNQVFGVDKTCRIPLAPHARDPLPAKN